MKKLNIKTVDEIDGITKAEIKITDEGYFITSTIDQESLKLYLEEIIKNLAFDPEDKEFISKEIL